MLVLKLCKNDEINRHVEVSLACASVEVTHLANGGYLIRAYKILNHQDCTEYCIGKRQYHACFIINPAGKTVDKYYYSESTAQENEAS